MLPTITQRELQPTPAVVQTKDFMNRPKVSYYPKLIHGKCCGASEILTAEWYPEQ